jgi:Flp pilus assembly protein TadG
LAARDVRVSEAAVSRPPIWARFSRDRRGAVAVAVAVLLPVLMGFAGIGIEVGLWFAIQRQNQSAADAAAISAALEYAAQIEKNGATTNPAAAVAATTTIANCNLFSTSSSSSNPVCPLPSSASNTITLYLCYGFTVGNGSCNTSSSSGAQPNAVQVALTQPLNTALANFVTAIWGPNINTIYVTTTAIAAFQAAGTACLLALDPTAANAVFVNNGTLPKLPNSNCWVASNSSSGSALDCNSCTIAGPTTVVGGDTVSNGGQLNGSPNRTYASAIADPYAASLTHAFLTTGMPTPNCPAPSPKINGTTYTYPVNCIINNPAPISGSNIVVNMSAGATLTQIIGSLSITGSGTIDLSPGTYWITDGSLILNGNLTLTCQGCSPGQGVAIIFTTTQGSAGTIGTLQVLPGGSLAITLNAQSTGPYAGYLLVQDKVPGARYLSLSTTIGNPSATLSGLLYFPSTSLIFAGTVRTDASCLVAVAGSLSLTGNIGLNDSGCPTAGLTILPPIFSVFLAV